LALGFDDENIAGSALKKGNQIVDVLSEEKESVTVDYLLAIPTLATPRSKSPQSFCGTVLGVWVEEGV